MMADWDPVANEDLWKPAKPQASGFTPVEPEAAPPTERAPEADFDIETPFNPGSERLFQDMANLTPEQAAKEKADNEILDGISTAQEERDQQFSFMQRQGNRLGVGYTRKQAGDLLNGITGLREEIKRLEEAEDPQQIIGLGFGLAGADPAEQAANHVVALRERLAQMENEYISAADAVMNPQVENREGETVDLPPSPAMMALQAAGDDAELRHKIMTKFFPEVAAETALPSISQAGFKQVLVPAAAAGATRIAFGSRLATEAAYAGSSGLMSAEVEYDASFSEYLSKEGVDLTDIEQVRQALDNPEIVAGGRKFATERGLSVGMWDMLGAYAATKTLVPPGLKNKLAKQFSNVAGQLTAQVGTGAAGEATAQVVTEGEITSPLDVELEAIGELPTAVSEPVVFKLAQKVGLAPKDLMTVDEVLDAYAKNPEIEMADALEALKEVAANGMSDEEARQLLSVFPGVDPSNVIENTHRESSAFGNDMQEVVRKSTFEDKEGNIRFAEEMLDKDRGTGDVYWSNGDYQAEGIADGTATENEILRMEAGVRASEAAFEIAQAQGAPAHELNTLSNVLEARKEAQARVTQTAAQMNLIRPELKAILTKMQEMFLPNTDVLVIEDNHLASMSRKSVGTAGAMFSPTTGKRTQVLYINTTEMLKAAQQKQAPGQTEVAVTEVMAHEFGHGMMQVLSNTLPPEVLGALKAEHRTYLAEALKEDDVTLGEVLGLKEGAGLRAMAQIGAPKTMGTEFGMIPDSKRPGRNRKEYHLSFNEWMADAVARQLSGRETTLSKMAKQIAPRLATMVERFNRSFSAAMPETTTDTFLRYVKAREHLNAISQVRESFDAQDRNSPAANTPEVVASMLPDLDLPREVEDRIRSDLDKYNKIMRWGATLLQLGKANKHIAGLQDYIKAVHEHWVTKSNWNDEAMQTLNQWRRLGRKTADEVGRFLLERTVQSDELGRALTLEEQVALMKQQGIDFGAKSEDAFSVIRRIDQDFARALDSLYLIEKNRINQDNVDFESRRKGKIAELDQTFNALRDRNYFPLSRFGVWGISMKAKEAITIKGKSYAKNETLAMELFENKRQRNKAVGRLKRKYGPSIQETFFKVDEAMEPFSGMPLSIMRALKDNPKLGLTDDQKKKMLDMIDTLSPTQSIAKRMLERKGTAGFSRDAQRGFGNYMMQIGGHLAKMQHVGQMDNAIQKVRASATFLGQKGIQNDKRYEIAEHLQRHQDYIMNPVNEWGGMRALAFIWFLGYNVKSALVNLTQIPLVAYPYLAARKELTGGLTGASDAIAIAELTKAMKDARNVFKFGGETMTEQEQNIIAQLVAEGIIDESLATELAGVAHGDLIQKMMPKETAFTDNVHRGSQAFLRGSTWLFQTAEKFNRRAVALATIRLAQKKGMTPTQQRDEAREALRTTQFEYARWNRAAFMRGKAGVLFVFMQYLQNVLSFTVQDPGRVRYILMLLMAAGLQGLPGAEDLMDLYDFANRNLKRLGRFEKDPRSDIREQLREVALTLDASPELIMHGLSAQSFGFGMNAVNDMLGTSIPALTFEGSISSGRIIPGWESLMSGREVGLETAKDVAGAAITIPMNILAWTRDEDPSAVRALERMAPSALKGPLRAYRGWKEGEVTDRTGNRLVDFDMNNPEHVGELIGMSLGASPTRLTRENERRWAVKEAQMYYATMRQNLQKDYNYAKEEQRNTGDKEAVKAATDTIKWFNRNVPKGQQLTTYGQNYAKWKVQVVKDQAGVGRRTLDIPLQREIDKTFPAATEERIR